MRTPSSPGCKSMSVFVGIPSYCDPVLGFTMAQAYEKAAHPDEVFFGVVDQSPPDAPSLVPPHIPASQVATIRVDAATARGCSWARSLVMSLYKDQDWYLQLDSHMMFEQGWDETLIRQANACMVLSGCKCVVSSYPENFRFVDGLPVAPETKDRLLASVPKPDSVFAGQHPLLFFKRKEIRGAGAVEGFHAAGGCLFAPGDYAQQIPADPYLYFSEEEQNISLRLYTHGWSIFHVRGMPIYHLYNTPDSGVKRDLPWSAAQPEPVVKPKWASFDRRSKKRLAALLWGDAGALGVYGLGAKRSLQDYALDTGIDYPRRRIETRAFEGPWDKADPSDAAALSAAAPVPPAGGRR